MEDSGAVNFSIGVISGELGFDLSLDFKTDDGTAQGV